MPKGGESHSEGPCFSSWTLFTTRKLWLYCGKTGTDQVGFLKLPNHKQSHLQASCRARTNSYRLPDNWMKHTGERRVHTAPEALSSSADAKLRRKCLPTRRLSHASLVLWAKCILVITSHCLMSYSYEGLCTWHYHNEQTLFSALKNTSFYSNISPIPLHNPSFIGVSHCFAWIAPNFYSLRSFYDTRSIG